MKLTEEGIEFAGIFYDIEELENIFQNLPKWQQNQKLRELIEKRVEEIGKHESMHGVFNDYVKPEFQKLLEENST